MLSMSFSDHSSLPTSPQVGGSKPAETSRMSPQKGDHFLKETSSCNHQLYRRFFSMPIFHNCVTSKVTRLPLPLSPGGKSQASAFTDAFTEAGKHSGLLLGERHVEVKSHFQISSDFFQKCKSVNGFFSPSLRFQISKFGVSINHSSFRTS